MLGIETQSKQCGESGLSRTAATPRGPGSSWEGPLLLRSLLKDQVILGRKPTWTQSQNPSQLRTECQQLAEHHLLAAGLF